MNAEESPWYEAGRADVLGRVWYPGDDDRWYRFGPNMEVLYKRDNESITWAQGWRG